MNYISSEVTTRLLPGYSLFAYYIDDNGKPLTEEVIDEDIKQTKNISGICFIGGEHCTKDVTAMGKYAHETYPLLVNVWWSTASVFPLNHGVFNYIKLGTDEYHIVEKALTKQRLYMNIDDKKDNYITARFADITDETFWSPAQASPDYYDYKEQRKEEIKKELKAKGLLPQ